MNAIQDYLNDDEAYGTEIVYDTIESIDRLVIEVDTRHTVFEKHSGTQIRIRYYAHEQKDTWTVLEEDGTLLIKQDERLQWFSLWTKMTSRRIKTLYIALPEDLSLDIDIDSGTGDVSFEMDQIEKHGNIEIKSGTGNVNLEKIDVDSLDIHLSTGSVSLVNVNIAQNLMAESGTGNIVLSTVTAVAVELESSTGKIDINGLNATSLKGSCNTGNIEIENTTIAGNIELDSSTGSIDITQTSAGGFDIDTSTGEVTITVGVISNYRYDLKTDVGVVKVGGINQGTTHVTSTGSILIKVRVSTGTITIKA
jgi:DUF4097 and DUF4098 domain-containing protein YvlB